MTNDVFAENVPSSTKTFFNKAIFPALIEAAARVEGYLASVGRATAAHPVAACATAFLMGHLVGRAIWRGTLKTFLK